MNRIINLLSSIILISAGCQGALAKENLNKTLRTPKIDSNSTRRRKKNRSGLRRLRKPQPQTTLVLVTNSRQGDKLLYEILVNNKKVSSFKQLKKYDSNKDGKVSASDAAFPNIILKYTKMEGPGSTVVASDFGLASIITSSSNQLFSDSKGKYKKGTYTKASGKHGEAREYTIKKGKNSPSVKFKNHRIN